VKPGSAAVENCKSNEGCCRLEACVTLSYILSNRNLKRHCKDDDHSGKDEIGIGKELDNPKKSKWKK